MSAAGERVAGAAAADGAAGSTAGAPRLTAEQLAALERVPTNLLVAAAAGAGKTAVLTERVVERVLAGAAAGVAIDRLLVVTFTEAAAAEMRARIAARLEGALASDPGSRWLAEQLTQLPRAAISTIHAFCGSVLRRHFHALGVDPAARVLSEHEIASTRLEAAETVFRRRLDSGDAAFLDLAEAFGAGRSLDALLELVLDVEAHVATLPRAAAWLADAAAAFDVPAGVGIERVAGGRAWAVLRRDAAHALGLAAAWLREARGLAGAPGGPSSWGPVLAEQADDLARLGERCASPDVTWAELEAAFTRRAPRLPPSRGADPRLREEARAARDQARRALDRLRRGAFGRPEAAWLADHAALAPRAAALATLVEDVTAAYTHLKRRRIALDFDDLERHALAVLDAAPDAPEGAPSVAALALRAAFDEVLVDEYQDVNPLQERILALVARDGTDGVPANRFLVGDAKQSIYGFRHTDVRLFASKLDAYGRGAGGRLVVLSTNWRSRPAVLDAANFLFRQTMTAGVGGLAYDERAELRPGLGVYPEGTEGDAPRVELHLLERDAVRTTGADAGGAGGDAGDDEDRAAGAGADDEVALDARGAAEAEEDRSADEREAALVAERIRELVHGAAERGVAPALVLDRDTRAMRPARFRDVVVLLRTLAGKANTYVDVLTRAGVPAHSDAATGWLETTEIATMLATLAVVDNPRQDVPLVAWLASPLVGLTAADLARVRLARRGGAFVEALRAAARPPARATGGAAEGEGAPAAASSPPAPVAAVAPELRERLAAALRQLDGWRSLARRAPPSTLVARICDDTRFPEIAAAMPGGPQRRANLDALAERAREFDGFARQGLFRFLRFVERLREGEGDLAAAPAVGAGEDVVRVLSIHAAKGLEYPIVVLADLGKKLNDADVRGDLLFHRELGLGPKVVDLERRVKAPSLAHLAVAAAKRLELRAEELRVLYVAVTRARERLVLVGSARGLRRRARGWAAAAAAATGWPLPEASLATATSMLDWIVPAVLRHRDAVELRAAWGLATAQRGPASDDGSRWAIRLHVPAAAPPVVVDAPPAPQPSSDGRPAPSRPLQGDFFALLDERPPVVPAGACGGSAGPRGASEDLWVRLARAEPVVAEDAAVPADAADVLAGLRARFGWRSPYAGVASRFAKMTVSELERRFGAAGAADDDEAREVEPARLAPWVPVLAEGPRFLAAALDATTVGAAAVGTATHRVLEHLDLAIATDAAGVRACVAELVRRRLLTEVEAAAVDVVPIAAFLASPLGRRLGAAGGDVLREVPFTVALPAREVHPDAPGVDGPGGDDRVVVQGTLDLFLPAGPGRSSVLVDFKTGAASAGAADRYRGQMHLYARAVRAIFGTPPDEAYLVFLASGTALRVPGATDP